MRELLQVLYNRLSVSAWVRLEAATPFGLCTCITYRQFCAFKANVSGRQGFVFPCRLMPSVFEHDTASQRQIVYNKIGTSCRLLCMLCHDQPIILSVSWITGVGAHVIHQCWCIKQVL